MIEAGYNQLSIRSQCDLLGVPRSSYYYEPIPETEHNLMLMKEIDKIYLDYPFYGSRRITEVLKMRGFKINRKRTTRLMKLMDIQALYPKPKMRTTIPGSIKFPYLLDEIELNRRDIAWGTDITYVPVTGGFIYLVAFLDLFSRYILGWKISNSLESVFCEEALKMALEHGTPEIIHSDHGVQYTSHSYINLLKSKEVRISMSGIGKCWDNIFVERFWRSLKYEEVYLKNYEDSLDANRSINEYIRIYNQERPHSALNYKTPEQVYLNKEGMK